MSSPGSKLDSVVIREYLARDFDLVGICPAVTPSGLSRFHQWLDAGYAGEMSYLPERREAYAHPRSVLEGVRSIVMLGSKYGVAAEPGETENVGKIARYARNGVDYHDVIHARLKMAKKHFESIEPTAKFRGVVDTAPLLEREFAQLAGIGWQGKNTMLISPTDGSWFFLSALLTDQTLEYDSPFEKNHCGTCTACLDACPTNAFVEPYVLDGSRCISYFTIESRSLPDPPFREGIGDWLFGCDICQEVCPWNRKQEALLDAQKASNNPLAGPKTGLEKQDLHFLFEMNEEDFRQRFRRSPFWRSKRRGILRNAAIVLGNLLSPDSIPALEKGLNDPEILVRAASAWALGRYSGDESDAAIRKRLEIEENSTVLGELKRAARE